MIVRLLLFVVVFIVTVVINFPYDRAIADRVARLEMRTGTQVDYTPVSASVTGVEWRDVNVTTRSGVRAHFDQAKLRPTWQGLSAFLGQGKAQARLTTGDGRIDIRMDQLKIDSGSPKFGTLVATGNVTHFTGQQTGEGSLRLELPDHHLPLPIDIPTFELGSRLFWQNKGGLGYDLRAEIKLTGGSQLTAEGNILLDPQPGAPHRLSGTLNFQTQLGKGKYTLMGTWKEPSWNVEYYK